MYVLCNTYMIPPNRPPCNHLRELSVIKLQPGKYKANVEGIQMCSKIVNLGLDYSLIPA